MAAEHIGVVSGLPDFANFMAALRRKRAAEDDSVTTILFGQDISLPEALQREFLQVVADAYPSYELTQIPSDCLEAGQLKMETLPRFPRKQAQKRIVYGNSIHKPLHQSFYGFLDADEFVFIDNGLSSYWRHDVDIDKTFASSGIPRPDLVCLSLSPPFPVPPYLAPYALCELQAEDFANVYARLRSSRQPATTESRLPPHVILGTSLFRTRHISWENERAVYLRLIDLLRERSNDPIVFKPHPRSSDRPLITIEDQVEVLDSVIPIEAFATNEEGNCAYSLSSTSLITLHKYFGYQCFQLETTAMQQALENIPHLTLSSVASTLSIDIGEL